jgi:hypothetical protein
MNERIRQLAEQAGFYFYDLHNIDGQDCGESIEADNWTAAEKFAELIEQDVIERLKTKKNSRYTDIVSDGGMDPRS